MRPAGLTVASARPLNDLFGRLARRYVPFVANEVSIFPVGRYRRTTSAVFIEERSSPTRSIFSSL